MEEKVFKLQEQLIILLDSLNLSEIFYLFMEEKHIGEILILSAINFSKMYYLLCRSFGLVFQVCFQDRLFMSSGSIKCIT